MIGFRARSPRNAWVSLWALFSLTALLAALALAVNAGWLSLAALELRTAGDAAALATSAELISDEWLRENQPGVAQLLDSARARALEYAGYNRVLGQPLVLLEDEVALGTFDDTGAFVVADTSSPGSLALDDVSIVRVTPSRLRSRGTGIPILLGALVLQPAVDLRAIVYARLDRDVIGFRARMGNPIPLVPLGLLSDPTASNPVSWENRIRDRQGPDDYTFDPAQGFVPGADGIPEFIAELQLEPDGTASASNAYLVQVGTGEPADQVSAGVSEQELAGQGGRLVLDANNEIVLSGTALGPEMGSGAYDALRDGLEALRTQRLVRIWPLVGSFDQGTLEAHITAFVAARVVLIEEPAGGPLRIRLQPAMRSVPHAITDAARRGVAHLVPNPYLGKVRLVR